jgi:hypothetical protein
MIQHLICQTQKEFPRMTQLLQLRLTAGACANLDAAPGELKAARAGVSATIAGLR